MAECEIDRTGYLVREPQGTGETPLTTELEKLHADMQCAMRDWLVKNLPQHFGPKEGACERGPDPVFYVEQTAMNMADAALAVVDCSLQIRGLG